MYRAMIALSNLYCKPQITISNGPSTSKYPYIVSGYFPLYTIRKVIYFIGMVNCIMMLKNPHEKGGFQAETCYLYGKYRSISCVNHLLVLSFHYAQTLVSWTEVCPRRLSPHKRNKLVAPHHLLRHPNIS